MVARGFTVMEVIVALAVLALIATAISVGEHAQLREVASSMRELVDSRRAASRLEEIAAAGEPLVEGTTTNEGVTETVRRRQRGLFEVTVEADGVRLTTLIRREPVR